MLDLVVLVADRNMLHALRGALNRPPALGTAPIRFEILTHPNRDGGVRTTGKDLLALQQRRARHGLLMLDHEGCGSNESTHALESRLDSELNPKWGSRAKAIVIEPELDVWMWGAENSLRDVFEWEGDIGIREWLARKGFQFNHAGKPLRPKEALEAVLLHTRRPRSSALYEEIATRLSLPRCTDAAFQRLRRTLAGWFPA